MIDKSLIVGYAKAIYSIAKEDNRVDKYESDLKLLSTLLDSEGDFFKLLQSPNLSYDEKQSLIDKTIKDSISVEVLSFVKVLIKKKSLLCIDKIKDEYNHLKNIDNGIIEGRIYTPFELSKEILSSIEKEFSKKYKKDVCFKVFIDKNVIGGMRVYIDDTLFDYSLQNKLDTIKKSLTGNR